MLMNKFYYNSITGQDMEIYFSSGFIILRKNKGKWILINIKHVVVVVLCSLEPSDYYCTAIKKKNIKEYQGLTGTWRIENLFKSQTAL